MVKVPGATVHKTTRSSSYCRPFESAGIANMTPSEYQCPSTSSKLYCLEFRWDSSQWPLDYTGLLSHASTCHVRNTLNWWNVHCDLLNECIFTLELDTWELIKLLHWSTGQGDLVCLHLCSRQTVTFLWNAGWKQMPFWIHNSICIISLTVLYIWCHVITCAVTNLMLKNERTTTVHGFLLVCLLIHIRTLTQ